MVNRDDWISCNKENPRDKEKVLVCRSNDEITIGRYYDSGSKYFDGEWTINDKIIIGEPEVIAWMPLPKPYRNNNE